MYVNRSTPMSWILSKVSHKVQGHTVWDVSGVRYGPITRGRPRQSYDGVRKSVLLGVLLTRTLHHSQTGLTHG